MKVLVKTLLFTIFVPGTVTVYLPYRLLPAGDEFSLAGSRLLAVFPIALGTIFYLWCAWDFAFTGRGTPAPVDPPKVLVSRGLYRRVRNPMYGGVILILIGESIVFGSWTLACYALVVGLAFHLWVVFYEEPTLKKKFGPAYEDYCQTVPRWIPWLLRAEPETRRR